jgi:hypothetical protein
MNKHWHLSKNVKISVSLRSHTNFLIRPSPTLSNRPYVHVISSYRYYRFYTSTSYRYAPLPALYIPYSHSTHSSTSNCIVFILIRRLRAFVGFNFIIESAGFDSPLIHLTSAISRYLYTWRRYITSIISRFSCVVPSFIRYLYRDFESI